MTDKIEIGEYVRTDNGTIDEFLEFDEEKLFVRCKRNTYWYSNIKNHSKNIIDLVEIGDFVNGKLIHNIDKGQNYCYLYYGNGKTFVDYQIEEILTKEKYKQNCFKVVE